MCQTQDSSPLSAGSQEGAARQQWSEKEAGASSKWSGLGFLQSPSPAPHSLRMEGPWYRSSSAGWRRVHLIVPQLGLLRLSGRWGEGVGLALAGEHLPLVS